MISRKVYRTPGSPPAAVQRVEESIKMVKIVVESFSEEELRKRWNELTRKESWDNECETCREPEMLHIGACSRKTEVGEAEFTELWKSWNTFKKKVKPIRKWQAD